MNYRALGISGILGLTASCAAPEPGRELNVLTEALAGDELLPVAAVTVQQTTPDQSISGAQSMDLRTDEGKEAYPFMRFDITGQPEAKRVLLNLVPRIADYDTTRLSLIGHVEDADWQEEQMTWSSSAQFAFWPVDVIAEAEARDSTLTSFNITNYFNSVAGRAHSVTFWLLNRTGDGVNLSIDGYASEHPPRILPTDGIHIAPREPSDPQPEPSGPCPDGVTQGDACSDATPDGCASGITKFAGKWRCQNGMATCFAERGVDYCNHCGGVCGGCAGAGDSGEDCGKDDDCAPGSVCDGFTHRCHSLEPASCAQRSLYCWPPKTSAKLGTPAPAGGHSQDICVQAADGNSNGVNRGKCSHPSAWGECKEASDCGASGFHCTDGCCFTNMLDVPCSANADCGTGGKCIDKVCR